MESFGFSVVRELEGHGIGKEMHENPGVPNYGRRGRGTHLVDGMALCIEPMVNAGGKAVYLENCGAYPSGCAPFYLLSGLVCCLKILKIDFKL